MSMSWDTFERHKQKGLDARRAGQWDSAKIYLLEAARAMVELSKQAQGDELCQARRQTAAKLLELARDCENAKTENRRQLSGPARESAADAASNISADQWLVKERPSIRFDDVAGLEGVKEDIRLKMIYPFEHADLAAKFGIRPGGGVLLYGPPGTGKTMLAKATAGEIDAAFFRISPADVLSKWVGEAEQNIKKLFDAPRRKGAALFSSTRSKPSFPPGAMKAPASCNALFRKSFREWKASTQSISASTISARPSGRSSKMSWRAAMSSASCPPGRAKASVISFRRRGGGLTIVVSPLISLMEDQVQQLRDDGNFPRRLLNSSLPPGDAAASDGRTE
jgi:DNA replication protein DnaC